MSEITYQEETSLSLPSTPETAAAAAAVAQAFLEDQEVVEDEGQPVVGVPMVVPSVPRPTSPDSLVVDPVDEPEPFDVSMFDPQLSPDLAELLEDEQPDFDAEARAEVAAELQAAEDTGSYYEGDPDATARLRALEKRNAFLEERIVQTNRGKWVQENLRAYPLLAQHFPDDVKAIDATSRRAFAREAAALHDKYSKALRPVLETLATAKTAAREDVRAEERTNVRNAWGVPAADLAASGASAEQLARIQQARKGEDLAGVIRAMIEPNPNQVL